MGKFFGTDGIRGIVNKDLTCDLALRVGAIVSRVMKEKLGKDNLKFLIGSDTRISKDMFVSTIASGVMSEGCHVVNVGVLPTPGISYLTSKYGMDGAFIISASHNPSEYNGIKVLDGNGFKISEEIEGLCEDLICGEFVFNQSVNDCGTFVDNNSAIDDYVDYLSENAIGDYSSIRILVDTAYGAASECASRLFKKIGAKFDVIHCLPDGLNINCDAGSTHTSILRNEVVHGKYDIGVAYDGDADRVILVDELGNEIDGDYVLAICGSYLKKKGKLVNNTLVGTVMSNLGLIKFCEENDINFVATRVGDKYVLEEMLKGGYILGGEQSGHIIFKELANTGDGELSSLQVLNIMVESGKKLSELASVMKKYPQVLINANVSKVGKEKFESDKDILEKVRECERKMNGDGRIVVRPSGTENYIRVMVEGSDIDVITDICKYLVGYIEKKLG